MAGEARLARFTSSPFTHAESSNASISPLEVIPISGKMIFLRCIRAIALRVEQHAGSTRIIRGVNGPILWSQGLLFTSGNFEHVVATSPAALTQAREFNRKNRRGTVNFAIGLGTWVTSLFIAGRHLNDTKYAIATVLGFAGGGFMFYSQRDRNAAATALSRSILLYNDDLQR